MDFLKELFGEEALTFEQFSTAVSNKGYKLADLSTGNYVDKHKHEDAISAKDNAISDLNEQIKTRDKDIKGLQKQLQGDADNETKIAELTSQLETLQGDYDTAKKDYEARLGKQSYEFAVKEFANLQQFTSNAAKKQFINEMVSENLKMKDGSIIGADDFMKVYKEANEDSFVVEQPPADPNPEPSPEPEPNKPIFVQPTPPAGNPNDNPFETAFSFTGVRTH